MANEGMTIGGVSDQGRVRDNNEDFYGYVETTALRVVMVCDGMGGAAGGEVASRTAVDTMRDVFEKDTGTPPAELISRAIVAANTAVYEKASRQQELRGMGTTCVLVAVGADETVFVAHVGDSRCYYLPVRGTLVAATKDHSRVQQMVDAGWLAPEDAETSEARHIITKAIGIQANVEPEIQGPFRVNAGDKFLLCSDGLTDMLDDATIGLLLEQHEPQRACEELVRAANERGGNDNITVSVIAIRSGTRRKDLAAPAARQAGRERATDVIAAAPSLRPHADYHHHFFYMVGLGAIVLAVAGYFAVLRPAFRRQKEAKAAADAAVVKLKETRVQSSLAGLRLPMEHAAWLQGASNAVYRAYPFGHVPDPVKNKLAQQCSKVVTNLCDNFHYGTALLFLRNVTATFPRVNLADWYSGLNREVMSNAQDWLDGAISAVTSDTQDGLLSNALVRIDTLRSCLSNAPDDFMAGVLSRIEAARKRVEERCAYVSTAKFAILDLKSGLSFVCTGALIATSESVSGAYVRICPDSVFPWQLETQLSSPGSGASVAESIAHHIAMNPYTKIKPTPRNQKPTFAFPNDFMSEANFCSVTQTIGAVRQKSSADSHKSHDTNKTQTITAPTNHPGTTDALRQ